MTNCENKNCSQLLNTQWNENGQGTLQIFDFGFFETFFLWDVPNMISLNFFHFYWYFLMQKKLCKFPLAKTSATDFFFEFFKYKSIISKV